MRLNALQTTVQTVYIACTLASDVYNAAPTADHVFAFHCFAYVREDMQHNVLL